jgi:hypothetical protein
LLCASGLRAQNASAGAQQVEALIKQLGDDRFKVREDATQRLIEIGRPALEGLRKAMLSADLEVATRAKLVVGSILGNMPHQLEGLRKAMQASIADGNYAVAMEAGLSLTSAEGAEAHDWLWYGHACQLAGRWKEAAAAYQHVQEEKAFSGRQRMSLAIWIARIQVGELKDFKSAAGGLAKVAEEFANVEEGDSYLLGRILTDLAAAQAGAGDVTAAMATWSRLRDNMWADPHRGGQVVLDIQIVVGALLSLPAGKPLPEPPCLYVLTKDRPTAKLMLNEEATQRTAYYLSSGPDSPHWKYAFATAPGQELDRMEFDCDVEQLNARGGGQFQCFVVAGEPNPGTVRLANLWWRKGTGRETCHLEANVPPGTKVVHIETGSWKDYFIVHSVAVKAIFRPVTKDPPALQPGAWFQTAALPAGGKIAYGDKTIAVDVADNDFKADRYTFTYEVPGRSAKFQVQMNVRPGRRYGFYANLDSPFRWTQTELDGLADLNLVTLGGGGHLAIGSRQGKIVVSRSADRLTWTTPTPTAFSGIFENIHPAAVAARDGTVHLAFFSNRLSLQDSSTAGYRLFLTSTRDGNEWSPLRAVAIGVVDGWPLTAPCLLQRADGECVVLWRRFAASAKSFKEIQALDPFTVEEGELKNVNYFHPQLTSDGNGLVHVVFDNFGMGLCHMTSVDGLSWSAPTALVPKKPFENVSSPQLIWAKDRSLLLYSDTRGSYLTPVDLAAGTVDTDRAIMITNHVIPLNDSRATITKEGEVFVPAGGDTGWILRAKMGDVLKAVSPPATQPTTQPTPAK